MWNLLLAVDQSHLVNRAHLGREAAVHAQHAPVDDGRQRTPAVAQMNSIDPSVQIRRVQEDTQDAARKRDESALTGNNRDHDRRSNTHSCRPKMFGRSRLRGVDGAQPAHAWNAKRRRGVNARGLLTHQSNSVVQYFHGFALPYLRWHSS